MLYVSTRNQTDTFTAYRALNEKTAPDGGVYIPFHLPHFTLEELNTLKSQSCCDVIAQILNLFFGVHLTGLDVEFEISKVPFKTETMQHKFLVAECWRNPGYSYDYILRSLYGMMVENKLVNRLPVGWACVGIKIALLFGMYSVMGSAMQGVDIAITAGDYSDLSAIAYAKAMGLPVGTTICACDDDSAFWNLINKGEYASDATEPDYMESILCLWFGKDAFNSTGSGKLVYRVYEEQQAILTDNAFAAVVSGKRVDSVISNMHRTNGYAFDIEAAWAYAGLQDYRSSTGVSKDTLLFSKNRPVQIKE